MKEAPLVDLDTDPEVTPPPQNDSRRRARQYRVCVCRARAADPSTCRAKGNATREETLRTLVASVGFAAQWPPRDRDVEARRGVQKAGAVALDLSAGDLTRQLTRIFAELVARDAYRGPRDVTRLFFHLVDSGVITFDKMSDLVADVTPVTLT